MTLNCDVVEIRVHVLTILFPYCCMYITAEVCYGCAYRWQTLHYWHVGRIRSVQIYYTFHCIALQYYWDPTHHMLTGENIDFDRSNLYRGTDVVLVCFAVHDPKIGKRSFENVSVKVLYVVCKKVCTVLPQIEALASISFATFLTRPLKGAGLYSRAVFYCFCSTCYAQNSFIVVAPRDSTVASLYCILHSFFIGVGRGMLERLKPPQYFYEWGRAPPIL